jgi:hypothetical protein
MKKIDLGRKNVALPSRIKRRGFITWLFYEKPRNA